MPRKPPTVPLYVRIPADLRARLDAATYQDENRPWVTYKLQDLVIRALYDAFPHPAPPLPDMAPPDLTPPPPPAEQPTGRRRRAAPKRRRSRNLVNGIDTATQARARRS